MIPELVIDALAVARLTRLVVEDEITRPVRDRIIEAAYVADGTAEERRQLAPHDTWTDRAVDDGHAPKLAYLVTCPWCASFYVAVGVAVARRVWPRAWGPVADVFAAAEVAGGLISR